MRKYVIIFASTLFMLYALPAHSEYSLVYKYLLEEGKNYLGQKKYFKALDSFNKAKSIEPSANEPQELIELIQSINGKEEISVEKPVENTVAKILESYEKKTVYVDREAALKKALDAAENSQVPTAVSKFGATAASDVKSATPEVKVVSSPESKVISAPASVKVTKTIMLDDALWQSMPKIAMTLEFDKSYIFEGRNIQKFLALTPGVIEVSKIDINRLGVKALFGKTLLYIWDEKGRWNLDINTIIPVDQTAQRKQEQALSKSEPFKLYTSIDWNTVFSGRKEADMRRQSLQYVYANNITGETPYGFLDMALTTTQNNEEADPSYYTIGLSRGSLGLINNYNLRVFDGQGGFSDLSAPLQSLRGYFANVKMLESLVEFSYFRGKDLGTFGVFNGLSASTEGDNYTEGARIKLFPDKDNNVAFNFARGFGQGRMATLPDRVMSVEGQVRTFDHWLSRGEIGYDENHTAASVGTRYSTDLTKLNLSFYNIHPEYQNTAGFPAYNGEIAGLLDWNWRPSDNVYLSSNLNLYNNLAYPNPDNENGVNIDTSTILDTPFIYDGQMETAVSYSNNPQEISPRTNFQYSNRYSKRFPIWGQRQINTFIQGLYQVSRSDSGGVSEYDRYSTSVGYDLPVLDNLNQFSNMEFSWIETKGIKTWASPSVFTSGFYYTHNFSDHLSGSANAYYRDEQNTEGVNSFLSGQDSLNTGVSASFNPSPDFQIYFDSRFSNVWAESNNSDPYREIALRGGVRTSLESPFSWTPLAKIEGYVYKDNNANGSREFDEPGVSGVKIQLGKKTLISDAKGFYSTKIRAKHATAEVLVDTIPAGYILSTPGNVQLTLTGYKTQMANFGLSTNTGIFGIVFLDLNDNKKPDRGEEFIPGVKIYLDKKSSVKSDQNGTFVFQGVSKGEHMLKIDINSIPLEYIPSVSLQKTFSLQEGSTFVFYIPLKKK
ncbi:MAG: hypothetical protein HQL25_06395 [Candidatus Omnitrophica bacterium]|nr:hypothetical protein [Candidatus Omnitrophota bacterium]